MYADLEAETTEDWKNNFMIPSGYSQVEKRSSGT